MCSRTVWSEAVLFSTIQLLALICRFLVQLFLRICTVSMESILWEVYFFYFHFTIVGLHFMQQQDMYVIFTVETAKPQFPLLKCSGRGIKSKDKKSDNELKRKQIFQNAEEPTYSFPLTFFLFCTKTFFQS